MEPEQPQLVEQAWDGCGLVKGLLTLLVFAVGFTGLAISELPVLLEDAPTEVRCADLAQGLPAKRWVRIKDAKLLVAQAYQETISNGEARLLVPLAAQEDAAGRPQATIQLANPDVETALRNLEAEAARSAPPRVIEGWSRVSPSGDLLIQEGGRPPRSMAVLWLVLASLADGALLWLLVSCLRAVAAGSADKTNEISAA